MNPTAPSVQEWVSLTSERVIQGDRLYTLAPPHFGATTLSQLISDYLGESAIYVDGSTFTEANQDDERDALIAMLQKTVNAHGLAQLVFDNYHSALKRTKGGRLQASLVALLVDGAQARDIGALFFARLIGPIHLDTRGSPLISRSLAWPLPRIHQDDLEAGADLEECRRRWGHLAVPMGLTGGVIKDTNYGQRVADVRVSGPSIATDFPLAVRAAILGGYDLSRLTVGERDAVDAFRVNDGLTQLTRDANLDAHLEVSEVAVDHVNSSPADFFTELVGDTDRVVWCDRYLFSEIPRLADFLRRVRRLTGAEINLLGLRQIRDTAVPSDGELSALRAIPGVKVRFMNESDVRLLHDRHLARIHSGGGFVLPTSRVLLGLDVPGSAVVTRASSFGVDYESIWSGSSGR